MHDLYFGILTHYSLHFMSRKNLLILVSGSEPICHRFNRLELCVQTGLFSVGENGVMVSFKDFRTILAFCSPVSSLSAKLS